MSAYSKECLGMKLQCEREIHGDAITSETVMSDCSVLQSVAECCSVLQYFAVCCSVLQCVAVCVHDDAILLRL